MRYSLIMSNLRKNSHIIPMHNLKPNFDKFLHLSKSLFANQIDANCNFKFYPRKPKMSDLEIVALACTAESLSIDSENLLCHKLKSDYADQFPHLIDRTNFNRRRRILAPRIAELSKLICLKYTPQGTEFVIDSIPVPICSNVRVYKSTICKDDPDVMPSTTYHASHRAYYYGFKMQLVISRLGIPFVAGMTTAAMHDSQYIPFLKEDQLPQCELIGDKGYISTGQQATLFEEAKIRLITPIRSNMKIVDRWTPTYRYIRKRIETLFSQMCDQLMLKRNYAKTSEGLFARIISKVTAISILQVLNINADRPINHLKHALRG